MSFILNYYITLNGMPLYWIIILHWMECLCTISIIKLYLWEEMESKKSYIQNYQIAILYNKNK